MKLYLVTATHRDGKVIAVGFSEESDAIAALEGHGGNSLTLVYDWRKLYGDDEENESYNIKMSMQEIEI